MQNVIPSRVAMCGQWRKLCWSPRLAPSGEAGLEARAEAVMQVDLGRELQRCALAPSSRGPEGL